jgi:hypothetical protein
MAKSARDMLFRVMAAEEQDDKNLRILNYAPGEKPRIQSYDRDVTTTAFYVLMNLQQKWP